MTPLNIRPTGFTQKLTSRGHRTCRSYRDEVRFTNHVECSSEGCTRGGRGARLEDIKVGNYRRGFKLTYSTCSVGCRCSFSSFRRSSRRQLTR